MGALKYNELMFKRPLKSGKDVIVPSLIERDTYFLTIHDVDEMGKKSKKMESLSGLQMSGSIMAGSRLVRVFRKKFFDFLREDI